MHCRHGQKFVRQAKPLDLIRLLDLRDKLIDQSDDHGQYGHSCMNKVDSPGAYSFGLCTRFYLYAGSASSSVGSSAMLGAACISSHAGYRQPKGNMAPHWHRTQWPFYGATPLSSLGASNAKNRCNASSSRSIKSVAASAGGSRLGRGLGFFAQFREAALGADSCVNHGTAQKEHTRQFPVSQFVWG